MLQKDIELNRKPKIAFLIMAHSKPEQLNLFIKQLLMYEKSYIYIHIDAKFLSIIDKIMKDERVTIIPKHLDVQWGDYSQIETINYLLEYASAQNEHEFYSLHSGLDLAIRPIEEYAKHLAFTNCFSYFYSEPLPNQWSYGGGLGRVAIKWPERLRRRVPTFSILRFARAIYGRLYRWNIFMRNSNYEKYKYYGGASWFTVRQDCVEEMKKYMNKKSEYNKIFVNSYCGDEIYYATLLEMLSEDRNVMNKNNLRYIDWKERGQKKPIGAPNICTMEFLDEIEESKQFFARKFDSEFDKKIIDYFVNKVCN